MVRIHSNIQLRTNLSPIVKERSKVVRTNLSPVVKARNKDALVAKSVVTEGSKMFASSDSDLSDVADSDISVYSQSIEEHQVTDSELENRSPGKSTLKKQKAGKRSGKRAYSASTTLWKKRRILI